MPPPKSITKKFVQNKAGDIGMMQRMLLVDRSIPHADVVGCSSYGEMTALMYQAQYGTLEAMEWLLTLKPPFGPANTNVLDETGRSALTGAVEANSPEKIRLLLEYGANRNAPLEYARMLKKDKEIIRLLESYVPGVNKALKLERERIRVQHAKEKEVKAAREEAKDATYEFYDTDKNTDLLFKNLGGYTFQNKRKENLSASEYHAFELEKVRINQLALHPSHAFYLQEPLIGIGGNTVGSSRESFIPCRRFFRDGSCQHGDDCKYTHMSSLSSPPPPSLSGFKQGGGSGSRRIVVSKKDTPCPFYFTYGPCRHGDSCQYSHVNRDSAGKPV